MKRLITALAALAGAFGLQAASFSETGTSFEPAETETPTEASTTNFVGDVTTQGERDTTGNFWNLPELSDSVEVKLLVTNYNQTAAQTVPQIGAVSHYATLSISTGKDAEVERYAKAGGAVVNLGEGENGSSSGVDGESLHFDSLVKFTAYDQAMDAGTVLGSDGKIAVWVYCDEDTDPAHPVTNLMVSAGFIDNGGSTVSPTNYICSVNLPNTPLCDTWHRVTIKAMRSMVKEDAEIYPGFAIAIDGNPVGTGEHDGAVSSDKGLGNLIDLNLSLNPVAGKLDVYGALFPSARRGIENANVKSVAFRGMGEVDDLVFTEDTCGIEDFKEKGSIAIRGGADVAGFTYTLGGSSVSVVGNSTSITWAEDMTVTISDVQIASGSEYVFDNITVNGSTYSLNDAISSILDMATISINTTLGGAMVDGKAYATAAEAFDYINGLSEVPTDPITVTLQKAATGSVVLDNGDATVVLDLAGNNITGDDDAVVITLESGALVITNSTAGIGHVISSDKESYEAVVVNDGDLTIGGGIYDGAVIAENAGTFLMTGGSFDAASVDAFATLTVMQNAVEAGLGDGYSLVLNDEEDYYVIENVISEYTVTYVLNLASATNAVGNITTYTSQTPEFTLLPAGCEGYTFNGWTDEFGVSVSTIAGGGAGNLVLYASWTADTYTINYVLDLEGATNAVDAVESYTIESSTITLLDAGCEGYTFNGWTNETGAVVTEIVQGSTGNVTLYATWEKDSEGFDGGDGATFNIASEDQTAIEPKLPEGKSLMDVADAESGMTYAQAYALDLLDTTGEEVEVSALGATIEMTEDGKVKVTLAKEPKSAYTVTLKVYTRASLSTGTWSVNPVKTFVYGNEDENLIDKTSGANAEFYKVGVSISDAP